jgi:hypothetical protein
MRKVLSIVLVASVLPFAAIPTIPVYAGDGNFAAGIVGGLAAGTLLGIAATGPRYYAPPPVYVAPEPAYPPECYWTQGQPYWDGYRGAWAYPRVRVCQ